MHPEALTEKGKEIFPKLLEFPDFYLAGGTALALQIGHRISVDFDLFCEHEIEKTLLSKIKRVFQYKQISPLINNPDELTISIDDVKLTFLAYPFPIMKPFVNLDGLKSLGILELAATKAYTVGRRGSFKDYVDLYYFLSGNYAALGDIIELAENKFGNDFNSRLFLEQLIYLDDVEEIGISFLQKHISKSEIEEFFIQAVKKISF